MALATRENSDFGSHSGLDLQLSNADRSVRQLYSDWYLGDPGERWSNPAKDAYDDALTVLQKEMTVDEYQAIWFRNQNSMQDVRSAVNNALAEYETKSKASKVRAWLTSCSARVMYYGAIMDTLSQHHPEYVSLAWGTMKFLFIAVLNHEELLTEISKAVTKVADVLPRTELHSILYPTHRMKEAVAMVYAKILEFAVKAIRWYKQGKVKHSFQAILKPFSLSMKPIIEQISECSRRVDELASAASKAEIRDLHVQVHGLNKKLVQITEMMMVQQQQQTLHNQSIFAIQSEYKHMFQKGQIEELQNTMLLEDTPTSDESLAYCKSMRNRRRQKMPTQLPTPALPKLKSWISDPSSSLLLAQGQGVRTSSLDFAADFLDAVLERGYPVFWALPSTLEEEKPRPSVAAILRSLISQILASDPGIVSEGAHPVTIKHFKGATTIQQWFDIFRRCVAKLPRLFIVIDVGLIEAAVEREEAEHEFFKVSDFIERMSEIVTQRGRGGLKIIMVSWKFDTTTSLEATDIFGDMQIYTDMGKRVERLMRQPKYRAIFRKRNQKFAEQFRSSVQASDD